MANKPDPDPLVAHVESAKHEDIAAAVAKLDPKQAEFFLTKLEALMKKRKIQITGYLVSLFIWVLCMFLALIYYGTHDGFVGWVFLLPFLLVGVIFYAFGRWAEKVGSNTTVIETAKK